MAGVNSTTRTADTFTPACEEFGRRGTLPLPVSDIHRHRRGNSLDVGSSGPSTRFEDYQDQKGKSPARDY